MGSCPFTADFPVQVPIHGDFPLPCLVTGRQSSLFDSFGVFWLRFWQFHPLLFLPPTALFNIDCFRATQVQSWPYNSPRTAVETHTFTVIECMLRFLSYLNLILNGGPVLRGIGFGWIFSQASMATATGWDISRKQCTCPTKQTEERHCKFTHNLTGA